METTLLTKENAHRVTMVRRVDAPESEPVAFLFRGKRHGYCSYSHLVGNPGKEEILAPADFKDWEVVEVAHPGYLEEYFKQACSSYNLTSFSPDERGESDIASHEKELHEDLQSMPEQQRERYMENYKRYFSAMIAANSRCASAMITGPARFNTGRNEKACNSHAKSVGVPGMARTCTRSDSQGYRSGQARRTASRGGVAEGQSLYRRCRLDHSRYRYGYGTRL